MVLVYTCASQLVSWYEIIKMKFCLPAIIYMPRQFSFSLSLSLSLSLFPPPFLKRTGSYSCPGDSSTLLWPLPHFIALVNLAKVLILKSHFYSPLTLSSFGPYILRAHTHWPFSIFNILKWNILCCTIYKRPWQNKPTLIKASPLFLIRFHRAWLTSK
jgi:hypothetical protein